MNTKIIAILAALSIYGCATHVTEWDRPGSTEGDMRAQAAQCERSAEESADEWWVVGIIPAQRSRERMYQFCLKMNGYAAGKS